jgi:hypothetical protein
MNAPYVREQLKVALRVARFEQDAVRGFDQTFDGFFRSFFGIVLCAPLYVLILFAERRIFANAPVELPEVSLPPLPAANLTFAIVASTTYLAHWIAFPLVMIYLTKLIGAQTRYVPFIVAFNWTSCVTLALTTLPALFYLIGVISIIGAEILTFPILMFAMVYHWKVAREALDISNLNAGGIVLIELLLGLFISLTDTWLRAGLIEG